MSSKVSNNANDKFLTLPLSIIYHASHGLESADYQQLTSPTSILISLAD